MASLLVKRSIEKYVYLHCIVFFYSTYLRLHYGVSEEWQLEKVPHAKQIDSISCGVFCLKVRTMRYLISMRKKLMISECLILEQVEIPMSFNWCSTTKYLKEICSRVDLCSYLLQYILFGS